MDHGGKKPEHVGAKKGKGAYWGRRVAAKKESNRKRRDKTSVATQTGGLENGSANRGPLIAKRDRYFAIVQRGATFKDSLIVGQKGSR